MYANSYVLQFTIIMGASAAILGLFGCCTASIKDKCSVCLYASCTTLLGLLFCIAAIIAMVIQS